MQKDTHSSGRSFKPYSAATLAILAIVGAAAVFASVAPASAASLTENVTAEIIAFLVPLAVLLAALLIEVTRLAVRNQLPSEPTASARSLRWASRRGRR